MSGNNHPFASLIKHEEKIRNTYRGLLGDAVQSNIRYFLKPFVDTHNNLLSKLKSYGSQERETGVSNDVEPVIDLSATGHLESNEDVDLNSLQSVLLFIAKSEADSLSEFSHAAKSFTDKSMKEYLDGIIEEKSLIANKADRLYHDMIESKIS